MLCNMAKAHHKVGKRNGIERPNIVAQKRKSCKERVDDGTDDGEPSACQYLPQNIDSSPRQSRSAGRETDRAAAKVRAAPNQNYPKL